MDGSKSTGDSSEFRKHLRHAYSGQVFTINAGNKEFASLDLSIGGVGLLSSTHMKTGERVHLAIRNRTIVVKGHVRHVRPSGLHVWRVGIAFDSEQPGLLQAALAG